MVRCVRTWCAWCVCGVCVRSVGVHGACECECVSVMCAWRRPCTSGDELEGNQFLLGKVCQHDAVLQTTILLPIECPPIETMTAAQKKWGKEKRALPAGRKPDGLAFTLGWAALVVTLAKCEKFAAESKEVDSIVVNHTKEISHPDMLIPIVSVCRVAKTYGNKQW